MTSLRTTPPPRRISRSYSEISVAEERFFKHCETGNVKALERAIAAGKNMGVRDNFQNSLLHQACSYGQAKCVQLLLENGADIHARDRIGQTPLHLCATLECAELLLKFGANPHEKDSRQNTPLHSAAWGGQPGLEKVMVRLIRAGVSPNDINSYRQTALHHATLSGNMESIRVLLEAGSDASLKNKDGSTPRDLLERDSDEDDIDQNDSPRTVFDRLLEQQQLRQTGPDPIILKRSRRI